MILPNVSLEADRATFIALILIAKFDPNLFFLHTQKLSCLLSVVTVRSVIVIDKVGLKAGNTEKKTKKTIF